MIAIAAAALETALYGLGHTSLAACQHGIILVHWPLPRWNHTAVPYAVIEPASLRAFNRLDRLTAMVGRQALVFQDSHPTGRGIVFVGPIPAAGGHIQLGPGPRRLWWYACHRDPAETAWTLLNLMAQAGDHRLAGWTGRPISAAELTGQPVDAAAGTWYTDVRELAGAEDEKKKFNFGGDGTDVDGIAAFFQILKHYLDGLP
ncbi:MAG: hypothetical protein LBS27_06120 [Bifidobacteriaceae bacterium]|nr:hypothetical protein [Bifidobacteriaceae bacterium]